MNSALQLDLQTPIRSRLIATLTATASQVLDAGVGRSFVGFQIETALAVGTTFTFVGYAGGDELTATPADMLLDTINVDNSNGAAAAAYTVAVANGTGYFPLDVAVFNGCRFIQVLSDVDNTAAVVQFASKPV